MRRRNWIGNCVENNNGLDLEAIAKPAKLIFESLSFSQRVVYIPPRRALLAGYSQPNYQALNNVKLYANHRK